MQEVTIRFDQDSSKTGGKEIVNGPVHVHKLRLVDPSTDRPGKVNIGYLEDGQKVRVFKNSGTILPMVNFVVPLEDRYKDREDGPFDTPPEQTLEVE